jgi:hypothetical protein
VSLEVLNQGIKSQYSRSSRIFSGSHSPHLVASSVLQQLSLHNFLEHLMICSTNFIKNFEVGAILNRVLDYTKIQLIIDGPNIV